MEKYTYSGEDFNAVFTSDRWKIGMLRYSERFSKLCVLERHLETDECFVLLKGKATLFIKYDDFIEEIAMEKNVVYNIAKGEWHHIVVSKDASVLVVENSDTSKENTEKVMIDL
ncbi:MAG: hypothetical protein IKK55_00280 [Clostridia bacterium]|nr:hypothetical protein [Clostridia bacterium]